MKLAVITTHPIQYQAPVWRALARQPGVDLQVIFASDFSIKGYRDSGFGTSFKWDQPLTEGYSFEVLGSGVKGGFLSLSSQGLEPALEEFGAEAVLINGYFPKFYIDAFRIARKLNLKVLLRAELTDRDRDRGWLAQLSKDAYARFVYHHVDRFLAIGENARSHLRRLGIHEEKIDFAGYNVDDDLFKAQAQQYLPKRTHLRSDHKIADGDFVFLVCGKLIAKKNPLLAVEAFNRLPEKFRRRCRLIFLGEGQLRQELEARMPADGSVTISGFVNQGELGKYYALADAALLPS
ncbi:MAG: glycosyltransferase family 4 protein, partial [Opitutales bacterium]